MKNFSKHQKNNVKSYYFSLKMLSNHFKGFFLKIGFIKYEISLL